MLFAHVVVVMMMYLVTGGVWEPAQLMFTIKAEGI